MTPTTTRTPTVTATPSVTATPENRGPVILHFGVVNRSDGCVFCCEPECAAQPTPTPAFDAEGRRIFVAAPSQFYLVIEAAPGVSLAQVGTALEAAAPDGRPDLQVQSTAPLGNGSLAICDKGPPPLGGGVPAISPPSFAPGDAFITNALLDLACRFDVHPRSSPCTKLDATQQTGYIVPAATMQFCNLVAATAALPPGDTLLTARVRDRNGELGPPAQIVVRVADP